MFCGVNGLLFNSNNSKSKEDDNNNNLVEGVVSRAFTAEVDSKAKITEPEPLISSLNTKTFAALEMGLLRRRVAIYKVCCAAAVS